MALTSGTTVASDPAVQLGSMQLSKRTVLVVHSPAAAAATVWLGASDVDDTTGFPLAAGETVTITKDDSLGMPASQDWYAYAASDVTLQVTEGN